MRSLARYSQHPPLRPKVQHPLMPSFRYEGQASYLCPLIQPHRRFLQALQYRPELHSVLASLQPPFLQPQQPLYPRLFQASQQRPFSPLQRRSRQLLLPGDLQHQPKLNTGARGHSARPARCTAVPRSPGSCGLSSSGYRAL